MYVLYCTSTWHTHSRVEAIVNIGKANTPGSYISYRTHISYLNTYSDTIQAGTIYKMQDDNNNIISNLYPRGMFSVFAPTISTLNKITT